MPLTEFGPKPVQQPHPPLYMGAFAPVALTRAGRIADGFTACCAPVDAILQMRQAVQDAATAAGRDGASMPTVVRCLVHRTDEPLPGRGPAGRRTGRGSRSTRTACASTRPASR